MVHRSGYSKLPSRSFANKGKNSVVIEGVSRRKDTLQPKKKLSAKFPKVSKRKTIE